MHCEKEAHFQTPVGSNTAVQRQRINMRHKSEERSAANNRVAMGISCMDLMGVPLGQNTIHRAIVKQRVASSS